MKKINLLFSACLCSLLLVGCSSKEVKPTSQNKEIQTLKHEKKELELLLENEKQKNTSQTFSSSESVKEDSSELRTLFSDFLQAEFAKNGESLKDLATAKLYTILVDKAGGNGDSNLFQSTVKNIEVYQAEQTDDTTAILVGKITVQTQVGEHAPNQYQQLVECIAVKNSEGKFQVDTQKLSTLAP